MTYKKILIAASVFGAIAVMAGAFGAHLLKELLSENQLSSFKTGNTYQFYHSLLLLLIGILYKFEPSKILRYAAWAAMTGMIFFSGSLYLLSCKDLIGLESTMILGPMTPVGGLFLVAAWVLIAIYFIAKGDERL